jgi:hypothetical protein
MNLNRFLRRIWRSVNQVCDDSAVVFAARSILIVEGVGVREDDDGRTRRWRRMSCEGCLVRSDTKNRFKACIVCTMLSARRATCNFDASTKRDKDENDEDKRWHCTSTTDEASCVDDGKETGGGC